MDASERINISFALSLSAFLSSAYALVHLLLTDSAGISFDYAIWISFFFSVLSTYLEVKKFFTKPLPSTILFEITGSFLSISGRIGSIIANRVFEVGYFFPLFGSYYNTLGIELSLLVIIGSFLVFFPSLIHAIKGDVISFYSEPNIEVSFSTIKHFWVNSVAFFSNRLILIALISGVFAFLFRFYPEITYGSWLIGWDTPEYVAHLEDFAAKLNPFTSYYWQGGMRHIPPMLDMLLSPFALIGKAYGIFKIYPSFAFGALASLSSIIAYKLYNVKPKGAIISGLFTSLFVLNLRISYDYQRQLLGSVFLLSFLLAAEMWRDDISISKAIALVALGVTASMSHEVVGFAVFVSSIALFLVSFKSRSLYGAASSLLIAVSSFFLEAWYWSGVVSYAPSIGYLPVGIVPSSYGIDAPLVLSYLIAGMGIAIPFSLYTMNKHPKLLINVSTIALLLAGISPLLAPSTSVTTWYRFLIGASPLVSTLSAVGAVESLRDWRALIAFFVIFSLPGLSFAYGYNLSTSYTRELTEFPYGLVPASADCGYLNVEKYFEENYSSKVPIIADPDIARYVHLAVRNPTPSELIWSYPSNSTFCYASSIYSEAFVVTRYDIASMNSICISSYTLEENIKGVGSSIYIYKISFENETNKS